MNRLTRRASVTLALAIASLAVPRVSRAIETTWINPTDGFWLSGSNWSNGVPTATDLAVLPSSLVPQNTVLNIDLEDGLISVDQLRFDLDPNFGTYNLTNGAIKTREVFSAGFTGQNQEINVGLTTDEGQTLSVGILFFSSGRFNVNRPIGLQTDLMGQTLGSDNIVVQGSGVFTAANTYTRSTYVMDLLTLSGLDGSIASSDGSFEFAVVARNGRLVLDNSNGVNTNRVVDGQTLAMKSSILEVIGNLNASSSENVGKVFLESGESTFLLNNRGSGLTVTAAEVTRRADSNSTFVLTSADEAFEPSLGLDSPLNPSELIGGGETGTTATPVIPWAVGRSTVTSFLVPVTFDGSTQSIRPLRSGEFVFNSFDSASPADPAPNVVFDSSVFLPEVASETTVNSLTIPTGRTLQVNAPLNVNSGVMIVGSSDTFNATPTVVEGSGSIELGESTGYLYVASQYNSEPQATEIRVPINGLSGLVKSGTGTLIMAVDQPGLNNGITVNRGIIKPLTDGALGNGPLTIAGGINTGATAESEAALHVDNNLTLPNPIISKTFGSYSTFGVLWYAPIVIGNNATLTLTSDLGGDSYFLLQNRFSGEKATLVLANTDPVTPRFISVFSFGNSEIKLTGKTGLSLEAFGQQSSITGNGETLGFFRLYDGQLSVGGVTSGPETLTAQGISISSGTVSMDLGGVEASDKLVLTGNSSFSNNFQISNAGLSLSLFPDYTPTTGQAITLIELVQSNDGLGGRFIDKDEGQIFSVGGFDAWLTYFGGDGNDVVLTFGDETVTFVLGDFNFDGGVDASDIDPFVVAANEGDPFAGFIDSAQAAFELLYPGQTLTAEIVNQIGDFNGDGGVDASDIDPFVIFANNGGSGIAAIPEPALIGLLPVAGLLLGRRRR